MCVGELRWAFVELAESQCRRHPTPTPENHSRRAHMARRRAIGTKMITGYLMDSIAFFFSSVTRLTFAMCTEKILRPLSHPKKRDTGIRAYNISCHIMIVIAVVTARIIAEGWYATISRPSLKCTDNICFANRSARSAGEVNGILATLNKPTHQNHVPTLASFSLGTLSDAGHVPPGLKLSSRCLKSVIEGPLQVSSPIMHATTAAELVKGTLLTSVITHSCWVCASFVVPSQWTMLCPYSH
jgi:hypothetical protein